MVKDDVKELLALSVGKSQGQTVYRFDSQDHTLVFQVANQRFYPVEQIPVAFTILFLNPTYSSPQGCCSLHCQ